MSLNHQTAAAEVFIILQDAGVANLGADVEGILRVPGGILLRLGHFA